MRKIWMFIFGSATANVFMILGLVLLGLAYYFGVNPADGSAVHPSVRGTWIHIGLFAASTPALLVLLVAGDGILGLALMVLLQICVYWTLGRVCSRLFSMLAHH